MLLQEHEVAIAHMVCHIHLLIQVLIVHLVLLQVGVGLLVLIVITVVALIAVVQVLQKRIGPLAPTVIQVVIIAVVQVLRRRIGLLVLIVTQIHRKMILT